MKNLEGPPQEQEKPEDDPGHLDVENEMHVKRDAELAEIEERYRKIRRSYAIGSLVGVTAVSTIAVAFLTLVYKEKERDRIKSVIHEEQENYIRDFDPKKSHEDILKQGKPEDVFYTVEWLEQEKFVPSQEYTMERYSEDVKEIDQLLSYAQDKKLNIVIDDMTQQEVDETYKKIIENLISMKERRKELVELHFFQKNDPRLIPIILESARVMGVDEAQFEKLTGNNVSVSLDHVGLEADPGQATGGHTADGEIFLPSGTLLLALQSKKEGHLLGLATVSNEACHYIRTKQYGSPEAYYGEYKVACESNKKPIEGFVTRESIPEVAAKYYDTWYLKYYSRNTHSPRAMMERESFYVSFLTSQRALKDGLKLHTTKERAKSLGVIGE